MSSFRNGDLDADCSYDEFWHILQSVNKSLAVTPLLLPRAAYLCQHDGMTSCMWQLIRLAGPGRWALRARLWRLSQLATTYKSGPIDCVSSWRLLQIKEVMGLLQEACLAVAAKPSIWPQLGKGQSGYTKGRSPYDPQLVLFDLTRMCLDTGRCLWLVMGDYVKAYPHVWRTDLLTLMSKLLRAQNGCMLLFEECLKEDLIIVSLSGGRSIAVVRDGLPEGGHFGTLILCLVA